MNIFIMFTCRFKAECDRIGHCIACDGWPDCRPLP